MKAPSIFISFYVFRNTDKSTRLLEHLSKFCTRIFLFNKKILLIATLICSDAHSQFLNSPITLPDLWGSDKSFFLKKTFTQEQDPPQIYPPNSSTLPQFGNSIATTSPSPQVIKLGNTTAGASIGASNTNFRFQSKNYLAQVGIDYASPSSNYGYGLRVDGSTLVTPSFALGVNFTGYSNLKEIVLNSVWMPENSHLKMKLSTAYMWGKQTFNFYSGTANANLNQASYFFSANYIFPKKTSDYFHTVGFSNWGSKAFQTNLSDPVYVVSQNSNFYNVTMDPRKLSTGTLNGISLDTQLGISDKIIINLSLGYESLLFPFSDGTQSLNNTFFQNYLIKYQPAREIIIGAGYKIGAAGNNISLSVGYGQWALTAFKNNGNNGVLSNHGIMLTYRIPLGGKNNTGPFNILTRPEDAGTSSFALIDAINRPVQLPQNFLAKVDLTAVKSVVNINKSGLPKNATVSSAADILVTVGSGGGSIIGVTRNGSPYSFSSSVQMGAVQLAIRTIMLPEPKANGDTFLISLLDSSGAPFEVTVTTAP